MALKELSIGEFESLLADGMAAGYDRDQIVNGLKARGVVVPSQMTPANPDNYLERLWAGGVGGLEDAAGGSLWGAAKLGQLANSQGVSPLGITPEVAKALDVTGSVIQKRGKRTRLRAQEGLTGLKLRGVQAAGVAGMFADAIVGVGLGAVARKVAMGKAVKSAVASVRSGSIDDAARVIDDLVGGVDNLAGNVAEKVDDPAARMAAEARRVAGEELANPQVPRSVLGAEDLPENVLDAARRESYANRRVAGEVDKLPGVAVKRDPVRLVEEEVSKVLKISDDVADNALGGLDDADVVAKEARESLKSAVAEHRGTELGNTPLFIKNFKQFGNNLAHQMFGRRGMAEISAARRERIFKKLIPDQALREDLLFYIQKTGNTKRGVEDTWASVTSRIKNHEDGELALKVGDAFRERFDNVLKELNDINVSVGDETVDYLDNYVSQIWDLTANKQGREFAARLKTMDNSEKVRTIKNYWIGITQAGLKPRTLDLSEVWHLAERNLGRVVATKKMLRDLGEFGAMTTDSGLPGIARVPLKGPGSAVPSGYRVIKNRILDNAIPSLGKKGSKETALIIHDDLHAPLSNLLKAKTYNDYTKKADKFFGILKRMNFSLSMFHAYSLTESSINALGLRKGLGLAGRLIKEGGAIPRPGSMVDDLPGGAAGLSDLLKTNLTRDNEARAMVNGVKVGAPPTDLMRGAWEDAMSSAVETLNRRAVTRPGGLLKGYATLQRSIDTALWDRYHHPMKVETFNLVYDQMLNIKRGGHRLSKFADSPVLKYLPKNKLKRKLADLSDEDIGKAVGSFINDEFGGQAWELAAGKMMQKFADPDNPYGLSGLSRNLFLSPDWNVSSIRAGTAFTAALGGNPVRAHLGFRHWRNAATGAFAMANMVNYVTTKAATGKGKFIWENEPGKKLWHIDTGMKDDKGRKIYAQWGKQYQEMKGLMEGVPVLSFLGRKTHPMIQVGMSPWTRGNNYPTELGRMADEYAREGREMGVFDYTKGFSEDVFRSVLPFMLTSSMDLDTSLAGKIGMAVVPLPKSKGMSIYRATPMLTEAYRKGDFHEIGKVQKALLDNGYTWEQVERATKSAQTKAMRYR